MFKHATQRFVIFTAITGHPAEVSLVESREIQPRSLVFFLVPGRTGHSLSNGEHRESVQCLCPRKPVQSQVQGGWARQCNLLLTLSPHSAGIYFDSQPHNDSR